MKVKQWGSNTYLAFFSELCFNMRINGVCHGVEGPNKLFTFLQHFSFLVAHYIQFNSLTHLLTRALTCLLSLTHGDKMVIEVKQIADSLPWNQLMNSLQPPTQHTHTALTTTHPLTQLTHLSRVFESSDKVYFLAIYIGLLKLRRMHSTGGVTVSQSVWLLV